MRQHLRQAPPADIIILKWSLLDPLMWLIKRMLNKSRLQSKRMKQCSIFSWFILSNVRCVPTGCSRMCSWASVLTSSKENEKTIRTTTALKKGPQILARAPSTLATLHSILNSDLNTHINCCLRLLLSIPHAKIWEEQIWEDYTKCRRPSHKDPSLTSCSSLVHQV